MAEMTQCPQCLAEIPAEASKCRHCGSRLSANPLWTVGGMAWVFALSLVLIGIGVSGDGGGADVAGGIGGVGALVAGFLLIRAFLRRE